MEDKLLTVAQASKLAGVSVASIRSRTKELGTIDAGRHGRFATWS